MRSYPLWVAAAAAIVAIAGCSSGGEGGPSSAAPTTTTATSSETHTAAPGAIEVSPGGVTTAVGADAESTEEEYSQACQAAKAWIDQQGGDRKVADRAVFEDDSGPQHAAGARHLQHPVGAALPRQAGRRHRRGPGGRRLALLTFESRLRESRLAAAGDPFPAPRDRLVQRAEDPVGGGHDAVGAEHVVQAAALEDASRRPG